MNRAIISAAAVAALVVGGAALAQTAGAPPADAPGPIAALQQQLKQAGYQPGPVNGIMTEQTKQAAAAYERRHRRPPPGAADLDPVRQAQAALHRLGMFDGAPDGVVGPTTRDAIIRFEASRQIPVDPRVSDRLLAELDRAAGAPAAAAPRQPAAEPANAPPPSAGSQPAPAGSPPALGRQPLPPGVTPPPIR